MNQKTEASIRLRGIGWDHGRCMAPLRASIDEYRQQKPEIAIDWDTRPLADFSDGELEERLDYDFIIFDHPYSGQIARQGWFYNLAEMLTGREQAGFERESLGPCWQSYHTDAGIWGLPIDAAAQTASYRPDLMDRLGAAAPGTLDEVIKLGEIARGHGLYIGFPFAPVDSISTFLTLCANAGIPVARDQSWFPEHADTVNVLETLKRLADVAHPRCAGWNPIRCYDHMSSEDDVCYVPYAFNYSNYSRPGQNKPIRFCDMPGYGSNGCKGSLLGGAGIGISKRCRFPEEALSYAKFLCSPDYQAGTYFRNGGQPASLTAWTTEENNSLCMDFFSGTLNTMQNAYLRPAFNGFIRHYREAGLRIRDYLTGNGNINDLADWLRRDYFS